MKPTMKFTLRVAAVFLLTAVMVFGGLVACGPPSKKTIEKLHAGSVVVLNELTFNASLPDELLAEKIIDATQYETVKSFVAQAISAAGAVEHGLAAALMVEKPSIASLALGVADIIANLRGLTSLVNNERVQKMFASVQIGLRVLGSYFALQVGKLRAAGLSDRQICETLNAPYDKGRFDLLASAYDGSRFDEWAAAL